MDKSLKNQMEEIKKTYQEIHKIYNELAEQKPAKSSDGVSDDYPEILQTVQKLVDLNNSCLQENLKHIETINTLQVKNAALEGELSKLRKVTRSRAFKISRKMVDAIKKPGLNTLLFPYVCIKLLFSKR